MACSEPAKGVGPVARISQSLPELCAQKSPGVSLASKAVSRLSSQRTTSMVSLPKPAKMSAPRRGPPQLPA